MSSPFEPQITNNTSKLVTIDTEISELFATLGQTGLAPTFDPTGLTGMTGLDQYFCEEIVRLQGNRGVFEFRKNNAQTNHDNWTLGFTGAHVTHRSDITTLFGDTYDRQFDGLRSQTLTRKNEFFDLYADADNTSKKEMLIKKWFRVRQ